MSAPQSLVPQPLVPQPVALIAGTAAGRAQAEVIARAWPQARLATGGADGKGSMAEAIRAAFTAGESIVAFLAVGAIVRIIAPLLNSKTGDPAVVAVDEAGTHAVAVLGGHAAGANDLATAVAELLGARPVITTATDATGVPGLDTLGLPVSGAMAAVSRALLDGEPVRLEAAVAWPLPALPSNVSESAAARDLTPRIVVTDTDLSPDDRTVVLNPPTLIVGMGASRGAPFAELRDLLEGALAQAGLSRNSLAALATADVKADEQGILDLAEYLGVPLHTYSAEQLAQISVPNPSEVVRAAVGTPSVSEAAALMGAGASAELLVPKTASAMGTVAIARHPGRGRLAIIGLGPGARDLVTPRAVAELRRASVVVGLDQYVDQIRDLLRPGTHLEISGLGAEEVRARAAVDLASQGRAVALIGSGDAGVYAMASPALEYAGDDIDVVGVPGVTAGLAASALLGAPLGHDHVYLSLSDLHTPWEAILTRVQAAAQADLVTLMYNPRSKARDWQLGAALKEFAAHRPADTPVGVVRHASRDAEQVSLFTLGDFDPAVVDMYSLVVVGSSQTKVVAGRMVTPRGYRWLA